MWLLIIPPIALLLALLWAALTTRPARAQHPMDSVEVYRRRMAALTRTEPVDSGSRRARRR